MAGARTSRGRLLARVMGALAAAAAAAVSLPAADTGEPPRVNGSGPGAAGHTIRLPAPIQGVDPLANVDLGLRPDRLLQSVVPGRVRNTEQVLAALGPSGAPAAVTDTQRLVIRGAGNYI